jgi:hypothetical protein
MARNDMTSKLAATEVNKVVRSKTASKIAKSWLDSLLTQASNRNSAPWCTAVKRCPKVMQRPAP